MIRPTHLLISIAVIFGPQVCDADERMQASSVEIVFSSRDISRCGNADFTAEKALENLLTRSRLVQIAELDLSEDVLDVEYVSESSQVCSNLRSLTHQALRKFEQSRAGIERIPPGWPERFVSEYFKIGTKYFEVVLQTNEAFEINLDPDKPLTQVWPGRAGAVKIFDDQMRQIAVVDLMGEILE